MQALDEIEAIKQLKARYFRLMDTKQWDAFGEVFSLELATQDADELTRSVAPAVPV